MSSMYTIGLRLIAHNGAGPTLLNLAGQLMHVHEVANRTNMALGQFRTALAGMAGIFFGKEMMQGAAHLVDAGAQFVAVQNQMIAQGWKQKDLADATAEAFRISSKYQSMGAQETLTMIKEMGPVLGDKHHAVEISEQMAKFYVAMQGTLGKEHAGSFSHQIAAAIRSGELSGSILQPEVFSRYLDSMAKTLKAFGGTITPQDFMMNTMYGRAAALNWNENFTNNILPTAMQEMKGKGGMVGNALLQAYAAIVGGRMMNRNAIEFDKLGLIDHSVLNPRDKSQWTPEGRAKKAPAGSVVGWQTFAADPYQWAWEYLVPAMQKHGVLSAEQVAAIKSGDIKSKVGHGAMQAVTKEMSALMGRQTAQGIMDMLVLQYRKFERDTDFRGGAMGLDDGVKFFNEKDYDIAKMSLAEQFENLKQVLGMGSVDTVTRGLHKITDAITGLVNLFRSFPQLSMGIVGGLAAAGLTIFIGGIATLASFLVPGGMLVVGITALAGAIAGIAAVNWRSIQEWFTGAPEKKGPNGGIIARKKGLADYVRPWTEWLNDTFTAVKDAFIKFKNFRVTGAMFNDFVKNVATGFIDAVKAIPGKVDAAVWAMGEAVSALIRGAIKAIPGMIGNIFGGGAGNGGTGARGGNPLGNDVPIGGPGLLRENSYAPQGGGAPVIIKTAINMDGRQIAERVTFHQARSASFVGSAATFDGMMHPGPVDQSYT